MVPTVLQQPFAQREWVSVRIVKLATAYEHFRDLSWHEEAKRPKLPSGLAQGFGIEEVVFICSDIARNL
jgi:hypothetical protein